MKHGITLILLVLLTTLAHAQLQLAEPDKSPMDMSYFPQAYPIQKFQNPKAPAKPTARVIYSRPQKKGRAIFGGEVKYNEMWRLGANETTEIEFFQDATINGNKVPKGRYTLYCIPGEKQWTIIVNKGLDTWGAFSYNKQLDLLRTDVPVSKIDNPVEFLTIAFDNVGSLAIIWDDVKVMVPIKYSGK